MLFSKSSLLAVAAAVGIASAATTTSPSAPEGSVMAHVVKVSDTTGSLTFSPNEITAVPGDLVQFHFYPMNHSVAQSTFANPCEPMPLTNGTEGFWSGFMPVTSSDTTMPVFTVLVKDTNPVWFYCATGKHCQAGMAGVINAPASTSKTLALYQAAAAGVAKTGIPDTAAGTGGDNNTSGGDTSTPPTNTGSGSSTNTSTTSPNVATSTNSGSALFASSAFALVAAAVAAALTF